MAVDDGDPCGRHRSLGPTPPDARDDGVADLESAAIPLSGLTALAGSEELARIWVRGNGGASFLIAAHRLASPDVFGLMLCEFIGDAAHAYATLLGIPKPDALARIWHGLMAARDDPDPMDVASSIH